MADSSRLGPNQRLTQARSRLLCGWYEGTRPDVEHVLREYPDLAADPDAVADLVHVEAALRCARGETPDANALCRRFPQHAEAIRARLGCDQVMDVLPVSSNSGAEPTLAPADPNATVSPAATGPVLPRDGEYPHVPGYEILEELGRGGMGVVYRARHVHLRREVALKMILAGAAGEMDRFRREAEALASLQHPAIVQIHEIGELDPGSGTMCPYFSLEFCPGGSLAGKLDAYREPRQAAELLRTLARAMNAAHRKGIIHRDLKPANILLAEDGSPKITDFGLARMMDQGESSGKTRTGAVMGTPSYMAPEQAAGKTHALGPPADLYALGAILYECLTGRPPFLAPTTFDTLLMVIEQEPTPPRLLAKVPSDLETICLKCLEKDSLRRYATAADLADDLERYLADEPVRARPPGQIERFNRWMRKHQGLAIAYVVVSVLALLALVFGRLPSLAATREQQVAVLVVVPVFGVFLRLVLLADLRWPLGALPVAAIGGYAGLSSLPRTTLFYLLGSGGLLWLLSFVAGFIHGRGWRAVPAALLGCLLATLSSTVLAALLLPLLRRQGGLVREFSVGEVTRGLPLACVQVVGLALVLGFFARIAAWALRREAGAVLLGVLVGAGLGALVGDWEREGITAALAEHLGLQWSKPTVTLYLGLCLGYLGAVLGGLLAPAHRPAGDQVVPSANSTRTRSASIRAVSAGRGATG